MRTLYQPAALEEFREAIIWYSEVAGQRQAEALDWEIWLLAQTMITG